MKRALIGLFCLGWLSCSEPTESTPPFIHVNVVAPLVGEAPIASDFTILIEAIVEGNPIQKVIDTPVGVNNPLPIDFVLTFSEEIRGQVIDISVTGFAGGVNVFSGSTTGIAGIDDVELVVGFCGDQAISNERGETCDDGDNNSDTLPDACRTNCLLALCGDGVVDGGEECDDGNPLNEDGCSSLCLNETCGDGVLQAALGEVCDNGAGNSDTTPDACRTDCQLSFCGDGVVDSAEDCEDGNSISEDGCEPTCLSSVVQISTGFAHTCVRLRTGNVRCWGDGRFGRLGYANQISTGDDEPPSTVGNIDIGGNVTQIDAGADYTCALLDTGNTRCWGEALTGRIGYGNQLDIGDNENPSVAGNVNVGGSLLQISAGGDLSCALLINGEVRCWGGLNDARLGYGNTNNIGDDEPPASAGSLSLNGTAEQLSAGGGFGCVILVGGGVRCWGGNNFGQLGQGNTIPIGDDELPSAVGLLDVGDDAIQISTGAGHTCILGSSGNVRCWGKGTSGQLGYGSINNVGDNEVPSLLGDVIVGGVAVQVAAGDSHTCALLETGNVRCWGEGVGGRLGYGNTNRIGDDETPASAGDLNIGGSVVQIATFFSHTCALLSSGGIRCWGQASAGQLGYGNTTVIGDDETPNDAGDVPLF